MRAMLTAQEQAEVWRRYRLGVSLRSIVRDLGHSMVVLRRVAPAGRGGARPMGGASAKPGAYVQLRSTSRSS